MEVTFEVDANGILNVKAEDKASGKSEKITITNDKGRLSQEEIEQMVQEAEKFAEEDRKVKEKIDARNILETYVYNMKNQVNDKDKLADKLQADEKEIEIVVKEAVKWLDDNQSAKNEDYEEKLKEVEATCNPIITTVYQRSGGAPVGACLDMITKRKQQREAVEAILNSSLISSKKTEPSTKSMSSKRPPPTSVVSGGIRPPKTRKGLR